MVPRFFCLGTKKKLENRKDSDIFSLTEGITLQHNYGVKMKIVIIDGYNMIHRCRFNWSGGLAAGPHQIVYNFFRVLKATIDDSTIDKVYFVTEGKPAHRLDIDSEYKANRVASDLSPEEVEYWDSFHTQKSTILDLVATSFPVTLVRHPNYEADDVIYYLAKEHHPDDDVKIVSSDTDFIQILNEFSGRVSLWNPISKEFRENTEYDYVKWKAMVGDRTDNIKGVPRIGKKTAAKILGTPGELEKRMKDLNFSTAFNKSYSLIKLADLSAEKDEVSFSEATVDWDYIRDSFNYMEFKFSFDEASWLKYTSSFEHLDNNYIGDNDGIF